MNTTAIDTTLPQAYLDLLNHARVMEAALLYQRERLERRNIRLDESRNWAFDRAKFIGMLDALSVLGIDTTEFQWIYKSL